MPVSFPPISPYPVALDSDYTLFLVYNTAEAQLTADNPPWAQDIYIEPKGEDQEEVWADNGFANISGELFYYDAVEKDSNGKVYKLKNCARNIGGRQTRLNLTGTWVRGFIIAEHHNQLVDAVLNIEDFLGENFSTDEETLDYRIRNLAQIPIIFDDFSCPDVSFDFNIIENDPSAGILANYTIATSGNFTNFKLDFGDGTSTTTLAQGSHRYAPNATIDPVLTLGNDKCEIVLTDINRTIVDQPESVPDEIFELIIPETPIIPDFIIPEIIPQDPQLNLPIIQFPCVEATTVATAPGGIAIDLPELTLPSFIDIATVNIPSFINIVPVDLPSLIDFGIIDIPSTINFGPAEIPSFVEFGEVELPSFIDFGEINIPSFIEFGNIGTIPSIIDFGPVSIPTVISIVGTASLPSIIEVGGDVSVPSVISVVASIPTEIVVVEDIPTTILAINVDIPSVITVESDIPDTITISGEIPSTIAITGDIPSSITISGDVPSAITIIGSIPTVIAVIDAIPTAITVVPPNISPIQVVPPSISPIGFGPAPTISVSWGSPPTINCSCSVTCPGGGGGAFAFDDSYSGLGFDEVQVDYDFAGFPSKIEVVVPPELPYFKIATDNLPKSIELAVPKIEAIQIQHDIPREIKVISEGLKPIELVHNMPSVIYLEADPKLITSISLVVPDDFPSIIQVLGIPDKIQVVGMPSVVEVVGMPEFIQLKMPDKPVIDINWGDPPQVKVALDFEKQIGENGEEYNCVAIVPCPKR